MTFRNVAGLRMRDACLHSFLYNHVYGVKLFAGILHGNHRVSLVARMRASRSGVASSKVNPMVPLNLVWYITI